MIQTKKQLYEIPKNLLPQLYQQPIQLKNIAKIELKQMRVPRNGATTYAFQKNHWPVLRFYNEDLKQTLIPQVLVYDNKDRLLECIEITTQLKSQDIMNRILLIDQKE